MKKRIILIMFLLLGSFAAWSQYVTVRAVDIIPINPIISDSVKVRVQVLCTDYGHKIYDSLSISGDTIHINYCIFLSPFAAGRIFTDTFELGTLAAGDYTVLVKAYKTQDTVDCTNAVDSGSATKSFTVTETVSVRNETLENGFSLRVTPNPAGSFQQVVITTEKPQNISIQLFDMTGRLVREVFSGEVEAGEQSFTADLTGLKSGTYVYRVLTEGSLHHLKTVKQ